MITKYPLAKINNTGFPDMLVAKYLGDKWRIQLKHLRKLARDPGLYCFHTKGLPAERISLLQQMVHLVAGKLPEDDSDDEQDLSRFGVICIHDT